MSSIETAVSAVRAQVGYAATQLDTGRELSSRADEVFFTASTFKVPLLAALYKLIDAGRIDPGQRIELTDADRVPGSSVLKELGAGLNPTVHDLATLMIIVSDNTATDLVFGLVGKDYLRSTMDELGLAQTRIPMTTRELLYSIGGLDPTNPEHTYAEATARLKSGRLVPDADGFSEEKSDVSSPADMSRLLAALHNGDALTPSSREAALDILKRQQLNTVIPMLLPTGTVIAHKTGSYKGVRCDVGIVYGPSGPYAVAIMAKDVEGNSLEVDLSLAKVSKAIYDEFNPPN